MRDRIDIYCGSNERLIRVVKALFPMRKADWCDLDSLIEEIGQRGGGDVLYLYSNGHIGCYRYDPCVHRQVDFRLDNLS